MFVPAPENLTEEQKATLGGREGEGAPQYPAQTGKILPMFSTCRLGHPSRPAPGFAWPAEWLA